MSDVDDPDWPPLTDADRQGIAEIRRQLDREFGALDDDPPPRRARRRRPFTLVAVGLTVLAGVVAVAVLRQSERVILTAQPPAAPEPPASRPAERLAEPPEPSPRPAVPEPPTERLTRRPDPPAPPPARAARPAPTEDSRRVAVRHAVDAWLDATRRGDITAQMAFYPAVVPVYYTWRNVPKAAVRAEKRKVFAEARTLDIRAAAPEIALTADGRAITRFRKAYVIEGPRVRRRGEVLQELRWTRTATGWKITSERDAAVLARY